MPVYVYKNLITGETFELQQRMTESALTEHPETGEPVKRLIQPVGIAFKGSGFYVTDSKSAPKASGEAKASEKKDGASDGASKGASEGKGESKGESKETAKASAPKD